MVEFHGIDRAINASAHEGRRRRVVEVTRRAHHIEGMLVLIVVLLRPLVVAWGLHGGGCIRGGLIACWSGRGAMMMRASERALSRELSTGGGARLGWRVTAEGPRMEMSRGGGSVEGVRGRW